MQQRVMAKVFRRAERVRPSQQPRAADGKQLLCHQLRHMQSRIIAIAEPDRDIHIVMDEVGMARQCSNPDIGFRMRLIEID